MHQAGREGTLRGTAEQLARIARCSPATVSSALDELSTTGAADIELRNGQYIITNRRMRREASEREAATERKRREREREGGQSDVNCHANVSQMSRPPSSSSSSTSSSEEDPPLNSPHGDSAESGRSPPRKRADYPRRFEEFWQAYPRKQAKRKALQAWKAAMGRIERRNGWDEKAAHEWLVAVAQEFAASPAGQGERFVPFPTTWLNQDRFDDDRRNWYGTDSSKGRKGGGSTSDLIEWANKHGPG